MKRLCSIFFVVLCCAFAYAQSGVSTAEPAAQAPQSTPPVITFTQEWDQASPPFFSISVDSTGRATYRSTPKPQASGDPYEVKFTFSDETRTKLFDLAKQVNYFRGDYDFKRSKIAYTGTKTLSFRNGDQQTRTTYNWSDNVAIQGITRIFQDISETIEIGRNIADKYRFDRLGVDAEVRKLENATKDERTAELQPIQPLLTRIAKDPGMMNITRRRAEQLLAKIPKSAQVSGSQ